MSFLFFTALSPFTACILSTRLTTEGTVDDQAKVTDGGSFGDGAKDGGTTSSFKGDVEQGKIRFCDWGDGTQSRVILRLLFLGCTVQVMADMGLHNELYIINVDMFWA